VNARATTHPTTRARYYAQRAAWLVQGLALSRLFGLIEGREQVDTRIVQRVRAGYRDLLERDLENAAAGLYPTELLTDMPSRRRLPRFLADLPRSRARRRDNGWNDLPDEVDLREYPPYYRRTFHWQTDGWFSRHSARIYDLSVEVLFLGGAAAMRRMALPHLVRETARRGGGPLRVLDVATGTGRFLGQIARTLPQHRYTGLDLSAWYLAEAREHLDHVEHLSLLEGDAEDMPLREHTADLVTSVFLFHELPPRARGAVLDEIARVLAPGGLAVLVDAVQLRDAPELEPVLDGFHQNFHEPFFRSWIEDDLEARVEAAGLVVEASETWHVSKVVAARKPG
jgi:ubiquinone/menaquinone biosynthesis C-methylase UbiE